MPVIQKGKSGFRYYKGIVFEISVECLSVSPILWTAIFVSPLGFFLVFVPVDIYSLCPSVIACWILQTLLYSKFTVEYWYVVYLIAQLGYRSLVYQSCTDYIEGWAIPCLGGSPTFLLCPFWLPSRYLSYTLLGISFALLSYWKRDYFNILTDLPGSCPHPRYGPGGRALMLLTDIY